MESDKKEDPQTQTQNAGGVSSRTCKIIAVLALIVAVILILLIVFADSSPIRALSGGKRPTKLKLRGGCGCVGAGQA